MDAPENLAHNLRQLRELRGYTQHQLAKLAGVPRPTLGHLESGAGNPTLTVLVRIASALGVTVDELIAAPRASARRYTAEELPSRVRAGVTVRQLVPDAIPGVLVERMELPVGARMSGVPHTAGTREYLCCERGRIELIASGESWALDPGDVVVFRGDQRHGYVNLSDRVSVAYSVVLPGGGAG